MKRTVKKIIKFIIPAKIIKTTRSILNYLKKHIVYMFVYKNKQLCFVYPFTNDTNEYLNLMKKALKQINIIPVSEEYIDFADFMWYHWIESSYEKNPEILAQIKNYAESGKKIIWNMHNRIPHETKNIQNVKFFMKTMAEISYKIIIHSNETIAIIKELCGENLQILSKVIFVPHPNYIGTYGPEISHNILKNNKLILNFFGAIRKYKNIELLISVIKELNFDDVELNIIGSCNSDEYKQFLIELIDENHNIKTDFRFIEDNELPEILANCHLFVLPYNLDSSLNSGTTILVFSYARSVLSSQTGTLADIKDKSLFFTYFYKNQLEHKEELKKQITAIRKKYKENYNELLTIGQKCKKYVTENNSLPKTAEQLKQVFYN